MSAKNAIKIIIICLLIFIFFFGYKSYDIVFHNKILKPIKISIKDLNEDIKNSISFSFYSLKGSKSKATYTPEKIWLIDKRFVKSICIEFNNSDTIKKDLQIEIKIGEKVFNTSTTEIEKTWEKIENKNEIKKGIYSTPENISLKRSIIKPFSKVINWGSDKKIVVEASIFALCFLSITIFTFLILILLKNKISNYALFNKIINNEIVIVLFVILTTLIIKFFTFEMIEVSGDAVWTWFNVKKLIFGLPYDSWDHHTTRLTKIVFSYIFQLIFGTNATIYYVAPIFFTVLSAIMIYKIGRLIDSKILGFFSLFFLLLFSPLNRANFQLIPSIFSLTSMLFVFYFFIKYLKLEKQTYLILSSLCFFIAYLSDVTNLFFSPVIAIALFGYKKRSNRLIMNDIILYSFILLALFALETIFYYKITGNVFGRIGIIKNTHLEGTSFTVSHFSDLFKRFTTLNEMWKFIFYTFIAVAVILLLTKNDKIIRITSALPLSFFFFATFAIVKLNPIKPVLKFNDRYLDATLPFIFISLSYFLIHNLKNFIFKFSFEKKILNTIYNLIVIAIIYMYIIANFNTSTFTIKESPLFITKIYEKKINYAYENKIPIVIVPNSEYSDNKFLGVVNFAFLNKNNIIKDRKIKLPELYRFQYKEIQIPIIINGDANIAQKIINDTILNDKNVILLRSSTENVKALKLEEKKISDIINYFDYYSCF